MTTSGHAAASSGFAPVAGANARILILGSLPGQRSIDAGQYYANPQNAFWPIMSELFGTSGPYEDRCQALVENRVALWDVLASSVRPGSMDAAIRMESAQANDFAVFFEMHPDVERVFFNGKKAAQLWSRLVQPRLEPAGVHRATLPSTSPAYASMSVAEKLKKWRSIIGQ